MNQQPIITKAKQLRANMTDAEQCLWYHLRRRQLANLRFRRQVPFACYIVDFVCFEKDLIIELDGSQHSEKQHYDAKRTMYLETQGFRVLRFWNNDVLTQTKHVLESILSVCENY
jgi:very-short-patch-repair endonuclease